MARVHNKPDVSFRTVGTAAKAAMKWRRAAQGELEEDESLMHDACTIIERKTMSRWGQIGTKRCQHSCLQPDHSASLPHSQRCMHTGASICLPPAALVMVWWCS